MKRKTHNKSEGQAKLQGRISISSKGTGYVEIEGLTEDIEINQADLNTALAGDTVEIKLNPKNKNRQTGKVVKVVTRVKTGFAGVLESEKGVLFLKPDDTKMYTDILIPKEDLNGAKVGEKVFAEIASWEDGTKAPLGKITAVLGKPGDNNTEMYSIALEKGFPAKLPDKVELEAKKIKERGISPSDYEGRKDFRKTLTFTIDPVDAKDFDDAISFKHVGKDEYEIGIHIADVSHYLKIGSAIDEEAQKRGTSVYLVDRTIPMLPEVLSNDLCSLVPNQDRLTMSAVFTIDKNAQIKSEWFGRTVIHSQKRLSYEEAEHAINKTTLPLHKELSTLNKLAKKLTKERFSKGAISLEQEEVKFVLDKDGTPIKVIKKERGDSNKLVEEFMLLANRKVAELMFKANKKDGGVFVYRIHDIPTKEKMLDLASFLRGLGHKVSIQNGVIPNYEINNLLEKLEEEKLDAVHRSVIRSMAKAIYSTRNIGHYGLAFEYYTHFTSPIRRYPDVIVHRMLMDYLNKKKVDKEKLHIYEEMSRRASDQEKRASEAERASIKYKQVEFMSTRLGQEWQGIVSGITEWGMYVEEVETKCEGLVRVRDMTDDYYTYDEKKIELIGQKKKKRYRLGDKVRIKVKAVDLERKTIDYALV